MSWLDARKWPPGKAAKVTTEAGRDDRRRATTFAFSKDAGIVAIARLSIVSFDPNPSCHLHGRIGGRGRWCMCARTRGEERPRRGWRASCRSHREPLLLPTRGPAASARKGQALPFPVPPPYLRAALPAGIHLFPAHLLRSLPSLLQPDLLRSDFNHHESTCCGVYVDDAWLRPRCRQEIDRDQQLLLFAFPSYPRG